MRNLVCALVIFSAPAWVSAGAWHTNYRDAWDLSTKEDKPILITFSEGNASQDKDLTSLVDRFPTLSKQFVLVKADKNTTEGKQLFQLFDMSANSGMVVVERSHEWQFCRLERSLNADEVETVLQKTAGAKGRPAGEVLATTVTNKFIESAIDSSFAFPTQPFSNCPSCRRAAGF